MANKPTPIDSATAKAADVSAKANDALWYTFEGTGRAYLVQRGTVAASDARASANHGYNTIEQAYSNPNSVNPATQATISQWNEYASLPTGGGTLGVIETVNITAPVKKGSAPVVSTKQDPATSAAKQDIPGASQIASVTGFLSALGDLNLWIRVAKVIAGGAILIVGLVKLTGLDTKAGGIAAKAVKVAPLL